MEARFPIERDGQVAWLDACDVTPDEISTALADLERDRAELWQRLMAPPQPNGHGPSKPEHLLTTDEVAEWLSVTPRWVRTHAKELGGTGTRKTLRFPEGRVQRWIDRGRR